MKITIIATDRIGCEESISLILDENSRTFRKLKKGNDEGFLRGELSDMEEESKRARYGGYPYFTRSQLRRLDDFEYVIHNKLYGYDLSLQTETNNK